MTDDLVAFLTARYKEDDQTARNALWAGDERWAVLPGQEQPFRRPWQVIDTTYEEGLVKVEAHAADNQGVAKYIAHWDPVRVLAEIAVNRRLLTWCQERLHDAKDFPDDAQYRRDSAQARRFLKLLAHPHTGHADFRPEWVLNDVRTGQ